MDRNLVRIGGRSHELGRPYLYATTKQFLQIFGLSSLEDLPRAELVRQAMVPSASDHESRVSSTVNTASIEEDSDVRVTNLTALAWEDEQLDRSQAALLTLTPAIVAEEDEDDAFDDEEDEDEDDDFEDDEDDLDDDEDDLDDEDLEEV